MCNFAGVNELQLGCRWSQSPSEVMIELISVLEPRPFDPGKPEKTSGWKVLLDCYARAAISSMQKIVSLGFFWGFQPLRMLHQNPSPGPRLTPPKAQPSCVQRSRYRDDLNLTTGKKMASSHRP